jgi:hypothetical protein
MRSSVVCFGGDGGRFAATTGGLADGAFRAVLEPAFRGFFDICGVPDIAAISGL